LPTRRISSIHSGRASAHEVSSAPKTVELEIRVARLELLHRETKDALETLSKRTIALKAQLDHLLAKLSIR